MIALLRLPLPPHVDSETAADYLRIQIGQGDGVIEQVERENAGDLHRGA